MIIIRNGIVIKLTEDELTKAYFERQEMFDMQYIKENITFFLPEEYQDLKTEETLIEEIAIGYREKIDEQSFLDEEAMKELVSETIQSYIKPMNLKR